LFLVAEAGLAEDHFVGPNSILEPHPAWIAEAVPEAKERAEIRSLSAGKEGGRSETIAVSVALPFNDAQSCHGISGNSQGAAGYSGALSQLVQGRWSLSKVFKQPYCGGDEQVFSGKKAPRDLENRFWGYTSHEAPPFLDTLPNSQRLLTVMGFNRADQKVTDLRCRRGTF
jgi:hypothetical protein